MFVHKLSSTIFFFKTESDNQTGINYVKENWYAQKVCKYLIDCEGQNQDSKIMEYCKALILGFVVLKVTERHSIYIKDSMTLALVHTKGQIISKAIFVFLTSPKKRTKTI